MKLRAVRIPILSLSRRILILTVGFSHHVCRSHLHQHVHRRGWLTQDLYGDYDDPVVGAHQAEQRRFVNWQDLGYYRWSRRSTFSPPLPTPRYLSYMPLFRFRVFVSRAAFSSLPSSRILAFAACPSVPMAVSLTHSLHRVSSSWALSSLSSIA